MNAARPVVVISAIAALVACSSSPSTATDAGAPDAQGGRVAQGPSCKEYLRCLASSLPEAVGPAVGAYGPESGCWANAETAALCEGACTDSREKVGCGGAADAGGDGGNAASDATYFVTCFTSLAVGDTAKRFNFVATSGWTFRALTISATRVDLAQTTGSAAKATERKSGRITNLSFPATFTLPGAANPVSGRDIQIDGLTIEGALGGARSCGRMSGVITSPIRQPFDPATDTCVLVEVKLGDPLPQVTVAEHACK